MRVVIAGGGNVGVFIASELAGAGHDVTIVEVDPDRVRQMEKVGEPKGATWLNADGCEVSDLAKADLSKADVVAAVTGDDEDNLVISLLSKQEFAVPRVVARINNPKNEWMFNDMWGVDVSVSTPHLLTALVEEAVSVGSLVRLLSFEGGRARHQEIATLGFPRDSTVVAVLRQDHVVVPRGDTPLSAGDEVLVLVTEDSEPTVRELLTGR
jgi:trk system potassium uptake protein TrkA